MTCRRTRRRAGLSGSSIFTVAISVGSRWLPSTAPSISPNSGQSIEAWLVPWYPASPPPSRTKRLKPARTSGSTKICPTVLFRKTASNFLNIVVLEILEIVAEDRLRKRRFSRTARSPDSPPGSNDGRHSRRRSRCSRRRSAAFSMPSALPRAFAESPR